MFHERTARFFNDVGADLLVYNYGRVRGFRVCSAPNVDMASVRDMARQFKEETRERTEIEDVSIFDEMRILDDLTIDSASKSYTFRGKNYNFDSYNYSPADRMMFIIYGESFVFTWGRSYIVKLRKILFEFYRDDLDSNLPSCELNFKNTSKGALSSCSLTPPEKNVWNFMKTNLFTAATGASPAIHTA